MILAFRGYGDLLEAVMTGQPLNQTSMRPTPSTTVLPYPIYSNEEPSESRVAAERREILARDSERRVWEAGTDYPKSAAAAAQPASSRNIPIDNPSSPFGSSVATRPNISESRTRRPDDGTSPYTGEITRPRYVTLESSSLPGRPLPPAIPKESSSSSSRIGVSALPDLYDPMPEIGYGDIGADGDHSA